MAYRQRQSGTTTARGGKPVYSIEVLPVSQATALAQTRRDSIDVLWKNADAYERLFFSGGAHAQILEAKLAGSRKALAIRQWITNLWVDYYNRKNIINERGSVDEITAINTDFSIHGNPPHSIWELLTESGGIV